MTDTKKALLCFKHANNIVKLQKNLEKVQDS